MTATLFMSGLLLGDSDYTLAIPDYDYVYNFKTTEGRFGVDNLAATNADDSGLSFGTTASEGASVKLSGEIINTAGADTTYAVIYAYYNDDMLVAMDNKDYSIESTKYFDTFSWTAESVPGGIEYDTVRVFVWDTIDGMEALADCKVYSE